MEAVRVYATAVSCDGVESITGLAALAVEAGSCNRSVIVLLRSGLSSREAAFSAVASSDANFDDRLGMLIWLGSDEVGELHADESWPTAQSRHAWIQFYEGETSGDRRKWSRETQRVRVNWAGDSPPIGTHVVLETRERWARAVSPAFEPLGVLVSALKHPRRNIVLTTVDEGSWAVMVEYFGPMQDAGI